MYWFSFRKKEWKVNGGDWSLESGVEADMVVEDGMIEHSLAKQGAHNLLGDTFMPFT